MCWERVAELKEALNGTGYTLVGDEPTKVTLATKAYGYTGEQVAEYLQSRNIHPEFADPDYLVLMFSPDNSAEDYERVLTALGSLPRQTALTATPPTLTVPTVATSLRTALFSPAEVLAVENCLGRVLASPTVGCPPAVPILVGGEVVDQNALRTFAYYGYDTLRVRKK